MDIQEKMGRRIPCGEDFSIELEAHEFSGIPESKAPCRIPDKSDDSSRKGIIRNLMREGLWFFRQNQQLEATLKAAKQTEKELRLELTEKNYKIQKLEQKIDLLEYSLEAQQKLLKNR